MLYTLHIAGNNAGFYLERMVVDTSGCCQYCSNDRWIHIQRTENPYSWNVDQFTVVGSWAGILDEIVSEVSMIISIIRYGWENMDLSEIEE